MFSPSREEPVPRIERHQPTNSYNEGTFISVRTTLSPIIARGEPPAYSQDEECEQTVVSPKPQVTNEGTKASGTSVKSVQVLCFNYAFSYFVRISYLYS